MTGPELPPPGEGYPARSQLTPCTAIIPGVPNPGRASISHRRCLSLPHARYMITSLDRTHAGFYRCIVRNRMGALLQRQTEVQVACK